MITNYTTIKHPQKLKHTIATQYCLQKVDDYHKERNDISNITHWKGWDCSLYNITCETHKSSTGVDDAFSGVWYMCRMIHDREWGNLKHWVRINGGLIRRSLKEYSKIL